PAHTARLVLAVGADGHGEAVEVVGTELGLVRALTPAEADHAVAHLGPDLLAEDWDPDASVEEAVRRIGPRPTRSLGEALLDQRNLAGAGAISCAGLGVSLGVVPRGRGAAW